MRVWITLAVFVLILVCSASAGQAQVSNRARYFGTISSGSSGITPQALDVVFLAYAENLQRPVGTGVVTDGAGSYSVSVVVASDFGNPQVTLLYRRGNNIYRLVPAGSSTFSFPFIGTPNEVVLQYDLEIGELLFSSGTGDLANASVKYDFNGDGYFNDKDTARFAEFVRSGQYVEAYDLNGDGAITSRDAVSLMKILRDYEFQQRRQQ